MIDTEQRLASDDGFIVDAGDALAEQLVLAALLQGEHLFMGHRQLGRRACQLAIAQLAIAGLVKYRAVSGRARGLRNIPLLRRRAHQHRAARGTGFAQLIPRHRNGTRAAGALATVHVGIDRRLFDANVSPIGVELFGDDHRESGLDTLSDFRRLGVQRDHTFRRDAQERVGRKIFRRAVGQRGAVLAHVKREHQATTGQPGDFEKVATAEQGARGRLCFGGAKHVLHVGVGGKHRCFDFAHDEFLCDQARLTVSSLCTPSFWAAA